MYSYFPFVLVLSFEDLRPQATVQARASENRNQNRSIKMGFLVTGKSCNLELVLALVLLSLVFALDSAAARSL